MGSLRILDGKFFGEKGADKHCEPDRGKAIEVSETMALTFNASEFRSSPHMTPIAPHHVG